MKAKATIVVEVETDEPGVGIQDLIGIMRLRNVWLVIWIAIYVQETPKRKRGTRKP